MIELYSQLFYVILFSNIYAEKKPYDCPVAPMSVPRFRTYTRELQSCALNMQRPVPTQKFAIFVNTISVNGHLSSFLAKPEDLVLPISIYI